VDINCQLPVEWLDALHLLGLCIHALVPFTYLLTYLLTYLHSWLGAYKTGNIYETVEDRSKVSLYKIVHGLSIAAKMYDFE